MWSEARIARLVVRHVFNRAVLCVPNCNWTGHEADLLVIDKRLRVIDVEIKVSRSDLRADARKDKWWRRGSSYYVGLDDQGHSRYERSPDVRRDWPRQVYRHYYVLPAEVWRPQDAENLSPASGIIAIRQDSSRDYGYTIVRRAKSSPDAQKLTPEQAIDVARLAGLRLWDAIIDAEAREDSGATIGRQNTSTLDTPGTG